MTIEPQGLSASACRDARTLLDLTQGELASAAEISVSTVLRCERGERVSDYASKQILAALEARGATFISARAFEQVGGVRLEEC